MNSQVEQYIINEKAKLAEKEKKKREKLLIKLGICERRYSDSDVSTDEYPIYDPEVERCYCNKASEITDEEFEEVYRYSRLNKKVYTDNILSLIVFVIGCVMIVAGVSLGIYYGLDRYWDFYNKMHYRLVFDRAISWWLIGLISGALLIGLAEVIKLLDLILKGKNNVI